MAVPDFQTLMLPVLENSRMAQSMPPKTSGSGWLLHWVWVQKR